MPESGRPHALDNIVVVLFENRSLDNVLGHLYGPEDGKSFGAHRARVAAEAGPGEVIVSRTVKDLVAGSGIEFDERGSAQLKGVPGEWQLYAVSTSG